MQKVKEHAGGVLRSLLILGMGGQILFGLLYLVGNFTAAQPFEGSVIWLEKLPVPIVCLIYALQLILGGIAAYVFLRSLQRLKKGWCLFGAMAINTVPQLLQCHLALLPYSITTSLMLLQLSGCVKLSKNGMRADRRAVLRMLVIWLLQILLLPEYWWLGLPVAFFFFMRADKRRWLLLAGAGLLGVFVMAAATKGFSQQGTDPAMHIASRFGWLYLRENYDTMPQELHELLGLTTVREAAVYSDGVERVLRPKMEASLEGSELQKAYLSIAWLGLQSNTKDNAAHLLEDFVCYNAPMAVMRIQLTGGFYDSLTGRNYALFKHNTPGLAKWYVRYAGIWCVTAVVIACILRCLSPGQRCGRKMVWLIIGLLEWEALYYTMQGAGQMDYKLLLLANCMWYAFALHNLKNGEEAAGLK